MRSQNLDGHFENLDSRTHLLSLSLPPRKQRTSVGPSKTLAQPRRNIVGCRIQHIWKEGSKFDGTECSNLWNQIYCFTSEAVLIWWAELNVCLSPLLRCSFLTLLHSVLMFDE